MKNLLKNSFKTLLVSEERGCAEISRNDLKYCWMLFFPFVLKILKVYRNDFKYLNLIVADDKTFHLRSESRELKFYHHEVNLFLTWPTINKQNWFCGFFKSFSSFRSNKDRIDLWRFLQLLARVNYRKTCWLQAIPVLKWLWAFGGLTWRRHLFL